MPERKEIGSCSKFTWKSAKPRRFEIKEFQPNTLKFSNNFVGVDFINSKIENKDF